MRNITCRWPTCPRYTSSSTSLCSTHQSRNRIGADMDAPIRFKTRETDMLAKLTERSKRRDNGCWEWLGARMPSGHGQMQGPDGRVVLTHRIAYELLVGPIPLGLVLDHLCQNPPCMNPTHLEPVTHRENTRRHRLLNRSDVCTKCGANDWMSHKLPSGAIGRRCRPCTNTRSAAYKRHRRASRQIQAK